MHAPQIRCLGCDKVFNPRGHSQHLSKPRNATCRATQMALGTPSVFQTVSGAGSSLVSNSNPKSGDNCGMELGNESNGELNISIYEHSHDDCTPFADGNEYFPEGADPTGRDTAHTVDATRTSDAANANLDAAHTSDPVDASDSADADLLEEMESCPSSFTNPEPDQPVEVQTPAPLTPPLVEPQPPATVPMQPTEPDANSSDTSHQVIVERFPHGRPGAPIPGAAEGASIYHSSHEAFGTSVWAPFHSQCDWEIAHWAKMRGPSSSAMAELLEIPEVRAH